MPGSYDLLLQCRGRRDQMCTSPCGMMLSKDGSAAMPHWILPQAGKTSCSGFLLTGAPQFGCEAGSDDVAAAAGLAYTTRGCCAGHSAVFALLCCRRVFGLDCRLGESVPNDYYTFDKGFTYWGVYPGGTPPYSRICNIVGVALQS
mmetsp:Transcript_9729/g.18773  ORF Transcript_9729/g.18773 Transcript_9729/m.18773 type:complete len:146 (-) Transcript_9729:43-480(-)